MYKVYEVGDKARIKNGLIVDKWYGGILATEEMVNFGGVVARIKEKKNGIYCTCYKLEGCKDWYFSEEMLDPITKYKYKTSEAIEMLANDPSLKFTSKIDKLDITKTLSVSTGHLHLKCDGCKDGFDGNISINEEWELVEEIEVPFISAIKALNYGKTIKCVLNGVNYKYENCNNLLLIKKETGRPITLDEILKGKWYVLN